MFFLQTEKLQMNIFKFKKTDFVGCSQTYGPRFSSKLF